MIGYNSISLVLELGAVVTGVFAVIFLFYTNSFLMKRRKKEFGLYNILGMENATLSRVILWETLLMALISLTGGLLVSGLLLDKLMFLLLLHLFDCEIPWDLNCPLRRSRVPCSFLRLFLSSFISTACAKSIYPIPSSCFKGGTNR